MNAPDTGLRDSEQIAVPRAIEVGFPIVEINRLAEPERNSFKPIYQMHKWFARRASCVFRAILLGTLKPAVQEGGAPTDLMAEFYKNHADDPDTQGKVVLDPFMGGGTTVVEALRLGCKVIGIDLNPVAWFVVKCEIEPASVDVLKAAFERLAARPVAWADGKPLRETLLDLYRTQAAPGIEADVIYTFWVKHAICTDQNCKKEVPLFKDYLVAQKTVTVRYWRDVSCPKCDKTFDWETQSATLIAERGLMVNAPRGAGGEGRPTAAWSHAPEPAKPMRKGERTLADLNCPYCASKFQLTVPWERKKERKKVTLTALLCPACETVWQWRGPLPEGKVCCPSCNYDYDPRAGNVPEKGVFQCSCGNRAKIIESLRSMPQDKRLSVRPYAVQAYLPLAKGNDDEEAARDGAQHSLFGDGADRQETLPLRRKLLDRESLPETVLIPENGRFFKRFTVADRARLAEAELLWQEYESELPYPKSDIPLGDKTKSGLLSHHYNRWQEMYAPRQLLALSTLLQGIIAERDEKAQELLLCAFSGSLELNNMLTRYMVARKSAGGQTAQGVFSRHDYQAKSTITENNVFGIKGVAMGSFLSKLDLVFEGLEYRENCWDFLDDGSGAERRKVKTDHVVSAGATVLCADSMIEKNNTVDVVITDPPYVGNVNYAELADFYYVWQRLALKSRYPWFAPEFTPKRQEIVENRTRGKSREVFFRDLALVFKRLHGELSDTGLLAFSFHHADEEGDVWEGLLEALCKTGFEISAVYPVQSESETSSHHQDKQNISYDLIHICRKRREDPTTTRSWAGVRQEVRRRARTELAAIEAGRYGGKPLAEPDVRLVCIGKCLELYSAHYGHVLDHEDKPLPLHRALQDISAIVDQLVTRERPLPTELENMDALSYVWLRCLMPRRVEVTVDSLSKDLRALRVSIEDVKNAGLVIRGRTGRGRTYEVKQPEARLAAALDTLGVVSARQAQAKLFDDAGRPRDLMMLDLWQVLIALASAGESVLDILERFRAQWPEIAAGLRYCRVARSDWERPIARVLAVMEGAPLFERQGAA